MRSFAKIKPSQMAKTLFYIYNFRDVWWEWVIPFPPEACRTFETVFDCNIPSGSSLFTEVPLYGSKGSLVRASPHVLCCVLEQVIVSSV